MDSKLTKLADALFCILYNEYLDRVKKKMPRTEAVEMGDMWTVQKEFVPKLTIEDVRYICEEELGKIGFLELSIVDGGFLRSRISLNGIRYMENRFKSDVNEVLEFLGKIKSAVPFL